MTNNIEIVNAAVTLIIKAAILAARFSGRTRGVQILSIHNQLFQNDLKLFPTKVIASIVMFFYHLQTMKQKLWLTLITYLAYCIDKELYKAIDYLREQVRVLVEQQEKQNKRSPLSNSQRMTVAAKAKRLSRKMLEQCTQLFTPGTIMRWYQKLVAEK